MLCQSARRRFVQQYLQRQADHLQLPWLCPALLLRPSQPSRHTQTLTRSPKPTRRSSPSPPLSRRPQTRELASAASDSLPYPLDDQYVPFSAISHDFSGTSPFTIPQLYDTTKLLMLENSLPDEHIRTRKGATSEIGGSGSELEATFQACLHVGRFERAENLIRQRLAQVYAPDSEELTIINHQYIQELRRSIELNRRHEDYKRLKNWVEKEMKQLEIQKDGVAYAALLRSAFVMLDGSDREERVRKYWKAVETEQLEASVIATGALTDADMGHLSEICPSEIKNFTDRYEPEEIQSEIQDEIETDIAINLDAEVATAGQEGASPVRSVAQRGAGLRFLQESLNPLSHMEETESPLGEDADEAAAMRQRQEQLEVSSIDAALRRWEEERSNTDHFQDSSKMGPFLWEWQTQFVEKIKEEIKLLDDAEKRSRTSPGDATRLEHGPFLRLVSPEKLAGITIVSFLSIMSKMGADNETKLSHMLVHIGKAVHMEALVSSVAERKAGEEGQKRRALAKFIDTATRNEGAQALYKIQRRLRSENISSTSESALSPSLWSNVTYAKVGGILAQLFTDIAKVKVSVEDPETKKTITAFQPAFQKTYRYELGKRMAFVSMHKKVEERLRKDPTPAFIVKHLPMVCTPKPWKGFYGGGYYKTDMPVIRVKNAVDRQRRYVEVAASRGDLDSFFSGLDVLGRTSWKVNPNVYKVMLEAWNSGEAVANLAPAEYSKAQPTRPENWSDVSARKRWYNEMRSWENEKMGLHSERCFQNLQMEIAQNYVDQKFYLPHNADFRGRAYPLAPYLNQMGADNARGLLLFGEGRELGMEGLRWLKIHLANVFGFDKASLKERELFAMDHLDDIRDSVENPLTGRKWWLEAEDPWQCLATCFELQQALDLPQPEKFVSHLPVHQDGSCNGLQHYAALGGDKAGAQQVNLEPGDRPSDVYTGVAELIKADIAKEAAEGRKIAQLLHGKIKRKIVKQTVMTNVYGVTFIGAMRQVKKQLEAHYPELVRGTVPISGLCASYIARKIFNALGSIFTGAHQIQFWLGDCASRISASLTPEQVKVICAKAEAAGAKTDSKILKSLKKTPEKHFRSGVTWTTPLNLTVVQPYRQVGTTLVSTAIQQVSIKDPQETDTVDKRRQLQAFPPNFVHSLDATHMILSALRCDAAGLSFSAVHDSFWTHAAGVNEMNTLLRDAFVQMHSEDVIGRLANEFNIRYSRHLFRATIRPGANPLRKKVESWRRQWKKDHGIRSGADQSLEELKLEVKRQELLRSEDPVERKEGELMVTPGSIFDSCDGEQYLQTQKSLGETALGHIPETAPDEIIKEALSPESTDPMVDVDMESSIGPIMSDHDEVASLSDPAPEGEQKSYVQHAIPRTLREGVLADLGFSTDKVLSDMEKLLVETMEEDRTQAKAREEQINASKGSGHQTSVHIWLPLRFAKVPKRGEWDVTRLKESDYFFS